MSNASSDSKKTISAGRPWGVPAAFIMVLAGFLVIPILVQIFLSILPALLGWDAARSDHWLGESPFANFLYVLSSEALTLGVLIWFIKRRKSSFLKAVALKRLVWRDIAYIVGGILAYFFLFIVAYLVIGLVVHVDTEQQQALGFEQGISGLGLVFAFVSLVVLPPIVEEIIFRGFVYGTLRSYKRLSVVGAIFITSIVFSVLHLFGGADGGLLWIAMLDTFVLSLVLCYVREKTGSLWASMGIHALKNGFVFINLFLLKAM